MQHAHRVRGCRRLDRVTRGGCAAARLATPNCYDAWHVMLVVNDTLGIVRCAGAGSCCRSAVRQLSPLLLLLLLVIVGSIVILVVMVVVVIDFEALLTSSLLTSSLAFEARL